MPVGNVTTAEVDHLAPQDGNTFRWDMTLPGFRLRVTLGGTKLTIVIAPRTQRLITAARAGPYRLFEHGADKGRGAGPCVDNRWC